MSALWREEMKIYKSQVRDAILNTPLAPGDFMDVYGNSCAVGQIIRLLLDTQRIEYTMSDVQNLGNQLTRHKAMARKPLLLAREGNLFGALSALFENVVFDTGDVVTPEVRQELLTFINNQFPETIEVSFDSKFN